MDSIRVSEAPDSGSIPDEATTTLHYCVRQKSSCRGYYYFTLLCQAEKFLTRPLLLYITVSGRKVPDEAANPI